MSKKVFAVILLTVFLATFAFAGCSGKPQGTTFEMSPESSPLNEEEPEDEEWNDETSAPEPDQSSAELEFSSNEATIEETVLVDNDNFRITAKGLTYGSYSVDLEVTIENKSDRNLSFVCGSLGYCCNSINGYMVDDGYLNCDINAGKKANGTINFNYDELMLRGITEIADIEIGFSISDEEYDYTYTGPLQIKTSIADTHDYDVAYYQKAIVSDATKFKYNHSVNHFATDTIYDANGVSIVSELLMVNKNGRTGLLLEAVNNSDDIVRIVMDNVAINGLVVSSWNRQSDVVNPGKRCIIDVNLSEMLDDYKWPIYGIQDVASVQLSLILKNADGEKISDDTRISIDIPGKKSSISMDGAEVYNKDGIRIISKEVMAGAGDYDDNMYIQLLAENTSGSTVVIGEVFNSLSVNGYMISSSIFSDRKLQNGECAALEITLMESALDENKIVEVSDITEVEIGLSIENERYETIDEPTITIVY